MHRTASRNNTRRNTQARGPKKPAGMAAAYAMNDFPNIGQEMALHAVTAQKDVVVTPTRISVQNIVVTDEKSGRVSYVDEYLVEGLTDRGQGLAFVARTDPRNPDEIRLASRLDFHDADKTSSLWLARS